MKNTRVVQISDLHVLSEPGAQLGNVDTTVSLVRVLKDIVKLSPRVDLIVASGDLVDDGSVEAYQRLQGLFKEIQCPVYVLAGNHDNTEAMRSVLLSDNIRFHRNCDIGEWRLLFVNTRVQDAGHGFIDTAEMSWLKQSLDDLNGQSVLLAMHHTPLKVCASSSCQLHNADDLLQLLSHYPQVKGLVAGHTHNDIESDYAHFRIMTTPSTMLQVTHNPDEGYKTNREFWKYHQADTSRHGYRVLDLQAEGYFDTQVRWVSASY